MLLLTTSQAISNINNLVSQAPFLSFILEIPDVILGVVTGLLPALVIIIVMLLPPIIARCKCDHSMILGM